MVMTGLSAAGSARLVHAGLIAAVAGGLFGSGVFVGYGWGASEAAPVPEVMAAAPAVRQGDGSLVLPRQPVAAAALPVAPHAIPPGATERRRVLVKLQPRPVDGAAAGCSCVPVDMALSLIEQDGGQRVIASATGADVLAGADLAIVPANLAPPRRVWAAGLSMALASDRAPGVWIERDLAAVRVRAEAIARQGQVEPRLAVGWSW